MRAAPTWFNQLAWSKPVTVARIRAKRELIPSQAGVYVFSKAPFKGRDCGVLYVGKASVLRTRLPAYLGLPEVIKIFSRSGAGKISSSLRHAGKVQLLMEIMHGSGNNVWLRWACYSQPKLIEGALIEWLNPAYNSRAEAIAIGANADLPLG